MVRCDIRIDLRILDGFRPINRPNGGGRWKSMGRRGRRRLGSRVHTKQHTLQYKNLTIEIY